ncbi:RHS repeat-associated core domain-containing protein, partial [Bacteroides fragilis]
ALGRRLSKSFGTTVTRWVWNGNVPLHQWKQHREYSVMEDRWNTDTERRNMTVWLFDEESFVPVAMLKEGRSYSILTDQLGTPTEAYDAEGNEVWSRVLDMDGNVIEETGNKGMVPFLFQGQYYDRETGLAYNRFRYYSPQMGMYVSQDPIGLAGGILNLYGYVIDVNTTVDILGLSSKKLGKNINAKIGDGMENHHLIPEEVWKQNQVMFDALGLDMDSADNGRLVPDSDKRRMQLGEAVYHRGSHPKYSHHVKSRIAKIRTNWKPGVNDDATRKRIRRLQIQLNGQIRKGNVPRGKCSYNKIG